MEYVDTGLNYCVENNVYFKTIGTSFTLPHTPEFIFPKWVLHLKLSLGRIRTDFIIAPRVQKTLETPLLVRKSLWATLENQSCSIVFTPHSFPQTSPRYSPQTWLQETISCFQKSDSLSKDKRLSEEMWNSVLGALRRILVGKFPNIASKGSIIYRSTPLLISADLEGDKSLGDYVLVC